MFEFVIGFGIRKGNENNSSKRKLFPEKSNPRVREEGHLCLFRSPSDQCPSYAAPCIYDPILHYLTLLKLRVLPLSILSSFPSNNLFYSNKYCSLFLSFFTYLFHFLKPNPFSLYKISYHNRNMVFIFFPFFHSTTTSIKLPCFTLQSNNSTTTTFFHSLFNKFSKMTKPNNFMLTIIEWECNCHVL